MNPKQRPIRASLGARLFAGTMVAFVSLCTIGPFLTLNHKSAKEVSAEESRPEETTTLIEVVVPETTEPEFSIDVSAPLPELNAPPLHTTPSKPEKPDNSPAPYVTLTESEQLILATLIRLEAGGSPYETKLAVASVVVNRMKMWGLSLRGVVFAKNVFSPAHLIDKETGKSRYNPPKEGAYAPCWQAMEEVCQNGPSIPSYVIYFRAGHHHTWATPYAKIGSMYFSYATKYTSVCKYCKEIFAKYEIKAHQKECSARGEAA